MATKTTAEFIPEVLLELGIISTEETPAADQYNTVLNRLTTIQEELEVEGLGAFDINAIPYPIYLPLVEYIAARCSRLFGVNDYPDRDAALILYRRKVMTPYTGRVAEIQTF